MVDKNLLSLFQIDNERATKGGSFLPEYVSGTVKYEWDSVEKTYSDIPKCVVITSFFYILRKSKLNVTLPPKALTEKQIEELNAKADEDEDISLNFTNLKIGLKSGYNGEVNLYATADSVEIV